MAVPFSAVSPFCCLRFGISLALFTSWQTMTPSASLIGSAMYFLAVSHSCIYMHSVFVSIWFLNCLILYSCRFILQAAMISGFNVYAVGLLLSLGFDDFSFTRNPCACRLLTAFLIVPSDRSIISCIMLIDIKTRPGCFAKHARLIKTLISLPFNNLNGAYCQSLVNVIRISLYVRLFHLSSNCFLISCILVFISFQVILSVIPKNSKSFSICRYVLSICFAISLPC